jgi:hypothetical protein
MKRAAKRMKKNAPELLNVELTLTQCQAMVARMAGFASFNDAMKYLTKPVSAARTGLNSLDTFRKAIDAEQDVSER